MNQRFPSGPAVIDHNCAVCPTGYSVIAPEVVIFATLHGAVFREPEVAVGSSGNYARGVERPVTSGRSSPHHGVDLTYQVGIPVNQMLWSGPSVLNTICDPAFRA